VVPRPDGSDTVKRLRQRGQLADRRVEDTEDARSPGSRGTDSGGRRRTVLVVGGVVLALALLTVGDWVRRDYELNELLDEVVRAERVQVEANDDLDRIAERAGPGTWSDADVRAFEDRAAVAAADLLVVVERVEDVTILPWHRELDRARDRYLEHAELWLGLYEDHADGREVGGSTSARINATFELAEDELRGAAVWLLGGNERDRIDRLFAE
jgi:hypothetical protein